MKVLELLDLRSQDHHFVAAPQVAVPQVAAPPPVLPTAPIAAAHGTLKASAPVPTSPAMRCWSCGAEGHKQYDFPCGKGRGRGKGKGQGRGLRYAQPHFTGYQGASSQWQSPAQPPVPVAAPPPEMHRSGKRNRRCSSSSSSSASEEEAHHRHSHSRRRRLLKAVLR